MRKVLAKSIVLLVDIIHNSSPEVTFEEVIIYLQVPSALKMEAPTLDI